MTLTNGLLAITMPFGATLLKTCLNDAPAALELLEDKPIFDFLINGTRALPLSPRDGGPSV